MEKSNLATLSKTLPDATEYPPMVCGSCHWKREKSMFGRPSAICVVMPKQVIAIAQSQGAQILSVNPVIEDLSTETCAMWKPLEGGYAVRSEIVWRCNTSPRHAHPTMEHAARCEADAQFAGKNVVDRNEQQSIALDMIVQGETVTTIATHFNVTPPTIVRWTISAAKREYPDLRQMSIYTISQLRTVLRVRAKGVWALRRGVGYLGHEAGPVT